MTFKSNLYTTVKDPHYDSHLHFFGVGLDAVDWIISSQDSNLSLPPHLEEKDLIRGFGWSPHQVSTLQELSLHHLTKKFVLSSSDGHHTFISSNWNWPQSILSGTERAHFLKGLPKRSPKEMTQMALRAQDVLLKNKIKRARHLTCDARQWQVLKSLEKNQNLKLELEVFFSEFMGQSLQEALLAYRNAEQEPSSTLIPKGLKIFVDGTFSGDSAFVSSKNLELRTQMKEIKQKMQLVLCHEKIPMALHTIGDQALEMALEIYLDLHQKQPSLPELHLEHAPLFSKRSLEILEKHNLKCVFHFQPSHWIEDHKWYDKNKAYLNPHEIYPFEFLEEHQYPYHFGSDAPVSPPSHKQTLIGLEWIKKTKTLLAAKLR